jgi:predicted nucleotidyltransferase component of viral defense system
MNSAVKIKALIRNLAREKNINAQILLRNYLLERLLERISLSNYNNSFVLKGGMLIAALVGLDSRSTIDMDATMRGIPVNKETVEEIVGEILSVPVNDGVKMKMRNIEDIREEADYSGYRVTIDTILDEIRLPLKVDITTGDRITPKAIKYSFQLMLEPRNIEIMAYNIETIIAEKLETIISRSTTNTRMRDFYDVFVLLKTQSDRIDFSVVKDALFATASSRGTSALLSQADKVISDVIHSETMQRFWRRYQSQFNYANDITWGDIATTLIELKTAINI